MFMVNRLICLAAIGASATIFAQGGGKPANAGEGTLMVKGKTYALESAAAYETKIDGRMELRSS